MDVPLNLETERLQLRAPTLADAEAVFETYAQDPEVVRYLMWTPHRSLEDTREFLTFCQKSREDGVEFAWVITTKSSGAVVGMLGASLKGHTVEIGYVLTQSQWGQGLMTEAATAVTEWWLAQKGIFRVQAFCDFENMASARVLERVGMQREGLIRRANVHPNMSPEPRDCFLYSRVKD